MKRALRPDVHGSGALIASILIGVLPLGCQNDAPPVPGQPRTWDCVAIERVAVVGQRLPARVMLVLDKSGSMLDAAAGGAPCRAANSYDSSSYTDSSNYVRCRWNEIRAAFGDPSTGVVVKYQSHYDFGLMLFPRGSVCAEGLPDVQAGGSADAIVSTINAASPMGGTPTAKSLLAVLSDPKMATEEVGRDRFVVLLTDGAPNCNDANAALCSRCLADPNVCWNDGECRPVIDPCDSGFSGSGCLDEAAAIGAVQTLRTRGIPTLVIGFGLGDPSDPAQVDARRVLNGMALAGGMPRDSEPYFYDLSSRAQIEGLFAPMVYQLNNCTYSLNRAPRDPRLMQVAFLRETNRTETVLVGPDDPSGRSAEWLLVGNVVALSAERCQEINEARASDRLSVEFRYFNCGAPP